MPTKLPMATIPMPTLTESDMASTFTTMEDEQLRFFSDQENYITNTSFQVDAYHGYYGMVMATMVESENLQFRIGSWNIGNSLEHFLLLCIFCYVYNKYLLCFETINEEATFGL